MSSQSTPFALIGSVAGGAIGSIGGPAGIAAGSQIGGAVGTVLQSVLAKPQDGAKTADAHWGGVTYGTFVPRGWGNHRTDGFVFWARRNKDGSYLFPKKAHKGKGGLFGGSVPVNHAKATFAFQILETGLTFPDGRQVERRIVIDRVKMADRFVWVNKAALPLPTYDASGTYYAGDYVHYNNADWWSVGDGNKGHTPGTSGAKQWWQKVSTSKNLNLHFHPQEGESTFTQAVSSVIASHKGVANTSANRGWTYGVADDIDLYDLGNTLPWGSIQTDWHFADPTYTLGQFLADVCGMAGMHAGSYDFSDVVEPMPGYRQTARQSGGDIVSQPLSVLGYDLATIDGVVRAVKRGGPVVAALSLSELGARLDGQTVGGESDELVDEEIPADRIDLPSHLKLGYYDRTAGYRQDFESSPANLGQVGQPTDISTDLVLTPDRAAQAAGYLNDAAQLEAGASFGVSVLATASPDGGQAARAALCAGDPVTVPWNGQATRFRITKTLRVVGLLRLTLVRDEPSTMVRHEVGQGREASAPDSATIVPTLFLPLSPATDLSDDLARIPGFYVFANGPAGWMGGQVVFTFDPPTADSRDWVSGPFVSDGATFGTTMGALDGGSGSSGAPAAPTALGATAGNAQVALSWTGSSGATSYGVKRGTASGGPYTTVQTGLTSTSFTDSTAANGTAYFYVVTAVNASGESAPSNEASASPSAPATPPSAPQSVLARGQTGRVALEWSPSSGATSYVVKRGNAGGSYADTVASGVTNTSLTDPGRTNGQAYHYAVYAVNPAGTSAASPDALATPVAKVGALSASPGKGSVALSWPSAAGATGYLVTVTLASDGSLVSQPTASGTSTTVTGLTNGTPYAFVVQGTNSPSGIGDPSDAVGATPSGGATPVAS